MYHSPVIRALYFTFILGTNREPVQYEVTVYRPVQLPERPINRPVNIPPRVRLISLLSRLNEGHIAREPNPTLTLVSDPDSNRIDSQPATVVWRNIHYQYRQNSFSAVTIQYGAELCYVAGYEKKLLKYIKQGLIQSYNDGRVYSIAVTVKRKERNRRRWDPIAQDVLKTSAKLIASGMTQKIQLKAEANIAKRLASAKNFRMIRDASTAIEHVAASIERNVARLAAREGEHSVAKKIPIVSTVLGIFFGTERVVRDGDWAGAFAEVASGIAADVPGVGTYISAGIDGGLFIRDIVRALEDEQQHKRLLEADKSRLQTENQLLRRQLSESLPESPVYGSTIERYINVWAPSSVCEDASGGCESYFDESNLANTDSIVKINVWSERQIYAIQMIYRHQNGSRHGRPSGGTHSEFVLGSDERITKVEGTLYYGVVASLTFSTDYDRSKSFGDSSISQETFEYQMVDGSYLAAIKGYDKCSAGSSAGITIFPAIGFIAKF